MKTLGILIGAALGLIAWTALGNVWALGGFNNSCREVGEMLQMDLESCRYNARQKTGAERQKHWNWCKRQHNEAGKFVRSCDEFSSQCYQGRVNWGFTVYGFLPSKPNDPQGIVGAFPGGAPGLRCPPAPDGSLPPEEEREAREREAREREEREAAVVFDPKCEGMATGSTCWRRVSGGRECWLLDGSGQQTVTWSGSCFGGVAIGRGTLTVTGGKYPGEHVGAFVNGKHHGRWVMRWASGFVQEGPFVNGKAHGRWVRRKPDGRCLTREMSAGEQTRGFKPC